MAGGWSKQDELLEQVVGSVGEERLAGGSLLRPLTQPGHPDHWPGGEASPLYCPNLGRHS